MEELIKIYIKQKQDIYCNHYFGFDKANNSYSAKSSLDFYLDKEVKLSGAELFIISEYHITKSEDFTENEATPDTPINTEIVYNLLIYALNELRNGHKFEKGTSDECKFLISQPFISSSFLKESKPLEGDEWIEEKINDLKFQTHKLKLEQLFSKLIFLSMEGKISPYDKLPVDFYRYYLDEIEHLDSFRMYRKNKYKEHGSLSRIIFGPSPIKLATELGNQNAVAKLYQCRPTENVEEFAFALLDSGIETQEIIDSCESFAIFKALSNNNISILSKCKHLKEIIIEICVLDSMFGNNRGLIMWFERKRWYKYFSKTRNIKDPVDVRFWVFDCLDNVNRDLIKYLEQKGIIYSSFDNSPANAEESIEKERTFSQNERLKKSGWSFSIVLENEYRIDSHYSQYCGIIYQMKTLDGITYGTRDIKCSSFLRQGTKISACIVSQYDLKNKDNSAYRMTSLIGKPR